ncbi:ornithine cyclodeaminase family protein [Candidatus Viridilinea mediisalina]|uniref:Delta(1)-pyrroline-2-carboxylate reductase n=1 Tax=Candidatus Viridilinea mediisalina TaxID=2024553 RepID=A0A2A6RL22_9CHLR|nr:ornithine cyclodeaminase [Candidatus Viridilinea mediisalina]PDW03579.1 ornithine cyclodeaminase [Candidatus Viridilinea mediisalina]
MRLLSAEDVRQAVPMTAAIDAVEAAFVSLASNQAEVPLRTHIPAPEHEGMSLFMPARINDPAVSALGVKVVSIFPRNLGRGLPTINALVNLFDPQTGQALAVLDGTYLTALRTGAASGVATRHLARADARVLALFGAGAQAMPQALAVCAVRPIERIWLVNRSRERAQLLAARMRGAGLTLDLRLATSSEQALAEADVVCTATSALHPLFSDPMLKPGTHINAIGAYKPTMAEVPPASVARARVFVDQTEAAWAEAGDLIQARDAGLISSNHLAGEIGAVAAGFLAGRISAEEITLFKSVGSAAQDLAVATLAVARAHALGLGTEVAW